MCVKPKVTVCIPVYNGDQFIAGTLESLLEQDYENMQIIVIDNASETPTCEVVEQFFDRGVTLIRNEKNVGMTGNFNKCLEHAQGEYLQILCADDRILPGCLTKKVAALEANPSCAMAISATEIRDEAGKTMFVRRSFSSDRLIKGKDMIRTSFRKHNMYGEPSNVLMRTACLKQTTGFHPDMYYAVDWEYWLRLSLTGDVYYINEPLAAFYVRGTSETGTLLKKKEKIIADDRLLSKKCRENPQMELTAFDGFLHSLNGTIRLTMKIVFAAVKNVIWRTK